LRAPARQHCSVTPRQRQGRRRVVLVIHPSDGNHVIGGPLDAAFLRVSINSPDFSCPAGDMRTSSRFRYVSTAAVALPDKHRSALVRRTSVLRTGSFSPSFAVFAACTQRFAPRLPCAPRPPHAAFLHTTTSPVAASPRRFVFRSVAPPRAAAWKPHARSEPARGGRLHARATRGDAETLRRRPACRKRRKTGGASRPHGGNREHRQRRVAPPGPARAQAQPACGRRALRAQRPPATRGDASPATTRRGRWRFGAQATPARDERYSERRKKRALRRASGHGSAAAPPLREQITI
jgi:hypothetical protein